MRLKESYFVNLPAYANKVMEFAMGVLNEKLKKRVIVSIIENQFCNSIYFFRTLLTFFLQKIIIVQQKFG